MLTLLVAGAIAAPLPDSPDSVRRASCIVEVRGTRPPSLRSKGCPDWVLGEAAAWDALLGSPSVGSWPSPESIEVDGATVRRFRVHLSPAGNRVRPIPVVRVRSTVEPVLVQPAMVTSCDVHVAVDNEGRVTSAESIACPVADAVEQAALAWRFRPFLLEGQAQGFATTVVVRLPSDDTLEEPTQALETFTGR